MTPLYIITALRESDFYVEYLYTMGSCYQFHVFLKKLYPHAKPLMNKKEDHVITEIEGIYYDITGVVEKKDFDYLTPSQKRTAKKWSFRRNNMIQLSECPACEEPLVYSEKHESYK